MKKNIYPKLLLEPKHVIPKEFRDHPVYFLAGPIRGGGGWQMKAAQFLWAKYPGCIVADPTRWDHAEKIAKNSADKKKIASHRMHSIGVKDTALYPSQVGWESEHMNLAAKSGTLIFWLEKESEVDPRPKGEGVYAQDTRVEMGMWLEKVRNNPKLKVKIGGSWHIDKNGLETKKSFGGMNFIAYYATHEKDRRKIYEGKCVSQHLVLSKNLKDFLSKTFIK